MPDHRYHPAADGWLLLCRDGLLLGLDTSVAEERVDALWALVRGGADSPALLDEMTRGGISAAPQFALLEERPEGWRVLARGAVTVEIDGAAPIDGRGATAWVERDVTGDAGLRVAPAGREAAGPARAIGVGVVVAGAWATGPDSSGASTHEESAERASGSAVGVRPEPGIRTSAEHRPEPEPAPEPQPEPAPEPPTEPEPRPDVALPEQTLLVEQTERIPAEPPSAGAGYDHLFGMTVSRKVEDAAVRDGDEPEAVAEDRTKVATGLAERRALRRAAKAAADAEVAATAPRHWLELSTGGREELEGIVIVGRAPSATRVSAGNIPRLVTMTTPNQDISRTHAQVALEGGTVVVTDLHSSNGTFVVLPGRSPQKLRAGVPTPVVTDTVIDLGDGATLTVRADG